MAKATMEWISHNLLYRNRILGGPSDFRQFESPASRTGCSASRSYVTIGVGRFLSKGAFDHASLIHRHAVDHRVWIVIFSPGCGIFLPLGLQDRQRERWIHHGPGPGRFVPNGSPPR